MWKWKGENPPLEDDEWMKHFAEELAGMARLLKMEQPIIPYVYEGKWINTLRELDI